MALGHLFGIDVGRRPMIAFLILLGMFAKRVVLDLGLQSGGVGWQHIFSHHGSDVIAGIGIESVHHDPIGIEDAANFSGGESENRILTLRLKHSGCHFSQDLLSIYLFL